MNQSKIKSRIKSRIKKQILMVISSGTLLLIIFGFVSSVYALSPPPPRSFIWKFKPRNQQVTIRGDIHANNNINIEGSATGVVTAGGGINVKFSSDLAKIAPYTLNTNSNVDWSYSKTISDKVINRLKTERAIEITDISSIGGDLNPGPSPTPEGGVFRYTNGDLVLSGESLTGRGTIIVENGGLSINGNLSSGISDMIGFIVMGGDVHIGSNVQNLKAAIYAPNGDIIIEPSDDNLSTISGLLIAKSITISRQNIKIDYNPRISGSYDMGKFYLALPGFSQIVPLIWQEFTP